jgi:hypothetical protein
MLRLFWGKMISMFGGRENNNQSENEFRLTKNA